MSRRRRGSRRRYRLRAVQQRPASVAPGLAGHAGARDRRAGQRAPPRAARPPCAGLYPGVLRALCALPGRPHPVLRDRVPGWLAAGRRLRRYGPRARDVPAACPGRHPGPPGAPAAALLRAVPPGVSCVLDAEGGDTAGLRRLAQLVDYPVFSRNGLRIATGETDPERGLRRVEAPRAAAVGVTLGEFGSLWRLGGEIHPVPALPVMVRDTTGCGDVFHGAFALALAEQQGPLDAARLASAVAALKAQRGNGWRGMPSRAEAEVLLSLAGASPRHLALRPPSGGEER